MSITPLGYFFFATVLFGIVLNMGVSRRLARNGEPQKLLAKIYVGVILVTISSLFFMFCLFGGKIVFNMVSLPKYEATIISFDSSWEEVERSDSDGDNYTENVLMHTPKLQFTDNTGEIITESGNIRSGKEPIIGDTVRMAYGDGNLEVISAAAIGVLIGLAFMLLILGYILTKVTSFTLGRNSKWVDRLGVGVFALIIYGGMLFMLGAMVYGVFKYFQPGSDMPLWAMLACLFFSLVLALTMIGMFTGLREEK